MSSSKRLLFISAMEATPWGGSEELWSRTALHLVEDGHQVGACVAAWDPLDRRVQDLSRRGVELHVRTPVAPSLYARLRRKILQQPLVDLTTANAENWINRFAPDLICVSNGGVRDGLHWMSWCAKSNRLYVIILHANAVPWWPRDDMAEILWRSYKSAARCFFVSKENKDLLEDQIGEELDNAEVVRNPFNISYDVDIPPLSGAGTTKLACIARLDPTAKGQDLLLRVLALDKWRNRDAQVSFFGTGPYEHGLRKLANRLGLGNVQFCGHVDDVEAIWRAHHALVLPSRIEGLPLALVEAMLCRRIAIVTDVAGNAEVVQDGVTGFVAPAPTMQSLDTAMERAWSQQDRWEEMGLLAREHIVRLVPPDPVRSFCDRLLMIARSLSPEGTPANIPRTKHESIMQERPL